VLGKNAGLGRVSGSGQQGKSEITPVLRGAREASIGQQIHRKEILQSISSICLFLFPASLLLFPLLFLSPPSSLRPGCFHYKVEGQC